MRISDWSSDVCSSDLRLPPITASYAGHHHRGVCYGAVGWRGPGCCIRGDAHALHGVEVCGGGLFAVPGVAHCAGGVDRWRASAGRSEEHTSELQSLMRISYAVFCVKKKK